MNLLDAIARTPWAIEPGKLLAIRGVLVRHSRGEKLSRAEIEAAIGRPEQGERRSNVVFIPLFGTISQRMNVLSETSGGTSTELWGQAFDSLVADRSVSTIVIETDSPGGSVSGTDELSRKIFEARKEKRIIAFANSKMASAAYWIASAAHEIVATPGALVGSIGVYTMHVDESEALLKAGVTVTPIGAPPKKGELNAPGPLTDESRAEIQAIVDQAYGRFVSALARNRNVSVAAVKGGFGGGSVLTAQDALAAGMVDRIMTRDELMSRLTGSSRPLTNRRRRLALLDKTT